MDTYTKGDSVKLIDSKSNLITTLKADGWKLKEVKAPVKKSTKK